MKELIAQIIGIIACITLIFSFQFKDNKKYFIAQLIGALLFSINYVMIGAYTGCVTNLINIFRSLVMVSTIKSVRKNGYYMLITAYTLSTIFTYEGWQSLLLLVSQVGGTTFMKTNNGKIIRIGQLLVISPLWLIYNIVEFSIGGIICEAFTMGSVIVSFMRYGVKNLDNKA